MSKGEQRAGGNAEVGSRRFASTLIRYALVIGTAAFFASAGVYLSVPRSQAQSIKRYKPQLVVQSGHAGEITYLAFSPDGRYALSSDERSAKLWDVATQAELRDLGRPSEATFSPDSRYLVEGLMLTDVVTGATRQVVTTSKPLDRDVLSVVSKDGSRFGFSSVTAFGIAELPSGKPIFTGNASIPAVDNDARMVATWGPIQTPEMVAKGVSDPFDSCIHITDALTGRLLRKIGPFDDGPNHLSFAADNSTLVAVTNNGFDVWNALSGVHVASLKTGPLIMRSFFDISPSGNSIVWANVSENQSADELMLWHFDQPQPVRLDHPGPNVGFWRPGYAYSPDGRTIAVHCFPADSDSGPSYASIVDTRTGKELQRIEAAKGPRQYHLAVAFDPTGKTLALGRGSGFRIYDISTRRVAHRFEGVANQPTVSSLSRTGDDLAVYVEGEQAMWRGDSSWRNEGMKVFGTMSWRLSTEQKGPDVFHNEMLPWSQSDPTEEQYTRQFIRYHSHYLSTWFFDLSNIDFNALRPDSRLNLWERLTIHVRDARDGLDSPAAEGIIKDRLKSADVRVWSAEVSPDSTRIALEVVERKAAGDDFDNAEFHKAPSTIEMWDLQSKRRLWSGTAPNSENMLSFSDDGNVVSAGSARFDTATGARLPDVSTEALSPEKLAKYGAMTINGRKVNIRNESTSVDIHDATTHEMIVQLYWLNDTDWAVITPNGLFDASEGAQSAMHFIVSDPEVGYEVIALDQFKSDHYVPGLLHMLFHYLVLLRSKDVSYKDVLTELDARVPRQQ